MLKFACKDVGLDCNFEATGATVEEVKTKAFAHAAVVHAAVLSGMSEEQKAQLSKTVESKITKA